MTGARLSKTRPGAGRAPHPRPNHLTLLTSTFATAPQPRPNRSHAARLHHLLVEARGRASSPEPRMTPVWWLVVAALTATAVAAFAVAWKERGR